MKFGRSPRMIWMAGFMVVIIYFGAASVWAANVESPYRTVILATSVPIGLLVGHITRAQIKRGRTRESSGVQALDEPK